MHKILRNQNGRGVTFAYFFLQGEGRNETRVKQCLRNQASFSFTPRLIFLKDSSTRNHIKQSSSERILNFLRKKWYFYFTGGRVLKKRGGGVV